MFKNLFFGLALAFAAFSISAMAPNTARADTCSDLQSVIQNPQGGTGGAAAAEDFRAKAQRLSGILCQNGAAIDATVPGSTPAQLAAATPPTACAAYTDPPMPATGATHAQIASSIRPYNDWVTATQTVQSCHHDEMAKVMRDVAVYDAAALVAQQRFIGQSAQLLASFQQQQAAFARAHANQ
ncbi:MAG: hypothetical protein QM759_10815 [Terricaulis sp.]